MAPSRKQQGEQSGVVDSLDVISQRRFTKRTKDADDTNGSPWDNKPPRSLSSIDQDQDSGESSASNSEVEDPLSPGDRVSMSAADEGLVDVEDEPDEPEVRYVGRRRKRASDSDTEDPDEAHRQKRVHRRGSSPNVPFSTDDLAAPTDDSLGLFDSDSEEEHDDEETQAETQLRGHGHTLLAADVSTEDSSDPDAENDTGSEYAGSFINDAEQTADTRAEADTLLAPEHSARRSSEGHFAVFIEYIAKLRSNPNFSSVADDDYFQSAIKFLRALTNDTANSIRLQTCLRPLLHHKHRSDRRFPGPRHRRDKRYGCHACWTRGREACDGDGQHAIWTAEGAYKRHEDKEDSFEDTPEDQNVYETEIYFKNNALAPKKAYAPNFKLLVGTRCSHRARASNHARHYLYRVAARVTGAIGDSAEFDENPDEFLEHLTTKLLEDFQCAQANWERFKNRFDSDEEWLYSEII
ncbi:hypothetical protein DFH06DRAFT_1354782 [Mycena polygramma]|nr:hypothetical protein DFH06DRAFT_1354782 [Mycena polygramma]